MTGVKSSKSYTTAVIVSLGVFVRLCAGPGVQPLLAPDLDGGDFRYFFLVLAVACG